MGRVADSIRRKLTESLRPSRLDIVDDSHRHAGHAGARPEGESHFTVTIVSSAFAGQSRVARQRLVYGLLAADLATDVHALSLGSELRSRGRFGGDAQSSRGVSRLSRIHVPNLNTVKLTWIRCCCMDSVRPSTSLRMREICLWHERFTSS